MQQYDTYKDSGVKWLGEIPSHWEMLPGLAIFKENKEKNSNLAVNTVLSLSYGKIVVKKDIDEGLVPAEYNTYQIVHPGYIIIRCTDLQNDKVSLRTGLVKDDGIITGAYLGLVTSGKYNSSYMHYFLHAWDITKEIYRHGNGLRQSLSWLDLRRLPILIPPIAEQTAIASYLDTATAKIDAAIAQQQKMIDLLDERKQIIINRAVTKGLNPNAKMKDSGVEWIGEVPEGWEVRRIKYILRESNVRSIDGHESSYSLSKSKGLIPFTDKDNLTQARINNVGAKVVKPGEIVFNRFKARLFAVSNVEAAVSPDYAIYQKIAECDLQYLVYLFSTKLYRGELDRIAQGVGDGFSRLYTEDLFSIYAIFPNENEQRQIVGFIRKNTEKIDLAISQCENQISLLQERKQIIINEVVTGKVKVTN